MSETELILLHNVKLNEHQKIIQEGMKIIHEFIDRSYFGPIVFGWKYDINILLYDCGRIYYKGSIYDCYYRKYNNSDTFEVVIKKKINQKLTYNL